MNKYFEAIPEFYTLNKRIFKENKLFFLIILIIFFFFDSRVLNIDLLNGYDVDEFYFLRILYSRQFYGFNHLDPQKFFSGFYSYGRFFWIFNFILTYIPFSFRNFSLALFITRLLSSLFAIQGLLVFRETLKCLGYQKFSIVIVCSIALLMIGFWSVGSWIHPDWMMMYFILIAFYYYFNIKEEEQRAPINFLIAIAIAIAIKVQTLQLVPLLLLYNFKAFFLHPSSQTFASSLKKCFISAIVIVVIFIALNPYLLHPQGFKLFYESFSKDMVSNKTNYWSGHIPNFFEKLDSFASSYLSTWITITVLIMAFLYSYLNFTYLKNNFEKFSFIISLVLMITYYSFFVNKTWPHYYLPIALMLLIVFYFCHLSIGLNQKAKNMLISAVLLLQVGNFFFHIDFLNKWLFPQKTLMLNNSYNLKDSIASFLNRHPDSKNGHIVFTFLLPIPIMSAGLDFNKVYHMPTVDHEQLNQISKLAPYPPDYIVVQKSMYYNDFDISNGPENAKVVALIDSIKQGRLDTFKLVESNKYLLYIKRIK